MKWGVVLAGAADFAKPADKLSLNTNMALMATGSIWTRWCFVIKPKNYLYVFPPFLFMQILSVYAVLQRCLRNLQDVY